MESGRLEGEPLHALCRRLSAESRTATIQVQGQDAGRVTVHLREGAIQTASTGNEGQRLGELLRHAGHIGDHDLADALQTQRGEADDRPIGEILVAAGRVPREVVRRALRGQTRQALAVGLAWSRGTWTVLPAGDGPQDVPLGLSVADAMMEAARHITDLEALARGLGSLHTVLDVPDEQTQHRVALTAQEWTLLTHLDGVSSVAEIAARAGVEQAQAARTFYGLLAAGVVQPQDRPAANPLPDGR